MYATDLIHAESVIK